MDLQTRYELIKGVGEEIITDQELKELLETKTTPIAYDGFELSGIAHLPFGVFRPLLLKDLLKAGVKFKLWIADWFGWINNKMGGDLEKIQKVGEYFIEVWKVAGIDPKKVQFIWASKSMNQEYWKTVIQVAKSISVARANRALSIMGRKAGELNEVAQYFYPCMQTTDIFHLDVDICQLGVDQRRANIIAREIAPKIGYKKPVIVSHHMLMGLGGAKKYDEAVMFDDNKNLNTEIESKMSKSKPESCIYVHDTRQDIERKLKGAYCKPKEVENNPMLDYSRHIIFRAFNEMEIKRSSKFGGDITFIKYQDLESAFRKGEIHPLDLKNAVTNYLDKLIKPIREHFEKNKKANELYSFVKKQEITR